MRFNKLDLNLLVALDVLLNERSITRAAERLHLSVSATSNALGRLREYFDDELLLQVGRKMELTPRAESLQAPVRDILVRVDLTVSATPLFDPSQSDREFRICASDYTQLTLGPHLFALARAQSGGIRISFLQQAAESVPQLERGEVDLLIIPTSFGSPGHPQELLFEDDFCCVVWQDSRLAQGRLTLARYMDAAHVVMQPPSFNARSFEAVLAEQQGMKRRIGATSYSFAATPAFVVGTDMIATLHRRLALLAVRTYPLVMRPAPLPMEPMRQMMQWHHYRTHDPGLMWLRGLLRDAAVRMAAEAAPAP
jgi:LysR family nod box-dependent transcriptional activator